MEPLKLPRGSVRSIITLLLLLVSALMLFVPVAAGADEVRAMWLMLTGLAVKDYFDVRRQQNTQDGPPIPEPYIGK